MVSTEIGAEIISEKATSRLHGTLRTHHTPTEELTNHTESILCPLKFSLEEIMLVCCLHLSPPDSFDGRVFLRAHWAFCIFIHLIEATLMKRVLAEEMHGRKVQSSPACVAPTGLENNGLGTQLLDFLSFLLGFRAVAGYQAAILGHVLATR